MFLRAILIIFAVCSTFAGKEEYTKDNDFPKDDYKTFFKDLNEALGLEQILDTIGFYFRTWVRIGQAYTWKKYNFDVEKLKESFTVFKGLYFIHKLFWVCVAQSGVQIINLIKESQNMLLHFLREKCDIYLGKNAALHPWNVMMDQNEQHISFLVFVYSLGMSLILLKILSWWNFMVCLAFGFLVYSFGGPYTVFRGLLTVTALIWFIVDNVLRYPFHTAVIILSMFALRYVWWTFTSLFGGSTPAARPPPPRRDWHDSPPAGNSSNHRSMQANLGNENKNLSILTSRIDGMERKTDMLTDRMERMSRSMERLFQNVEHDLVEEE